MDVVWYRDIVDNAIENSSSLLPDPIALVAIINGMPAVKLCSNIIYACMEISTLMTCKL